LTTPVIRALDEQIGAEVHYLTKSDFTSIVLNNPHVKKVISLTDDINETIKKLGEENYDHIIDLHHNLRSHRIKKALKKPSSSFYKLNIEKWLMVNFKINRLPDKHIVDRYMDTIALLGAKNDQKGLDFFIPPEKKVDIEKEWSIKPGTYASIVIGAAHETKCLTANQIALLCDSLQMPVVLLGGPSEFTKDKWIMKMSNSQQIKNACGRFDILQSSSILAQSGTIINHDTGLMHIAAALKKPQVVIWGNTIPSFGMYPYYGDQKIKWISFEQNDLKCRPCTKLGFEKCPKGHFKCILDHDVKLIAKEALNLITDY